MAGPDSVVSLVRTFIGPALFFLINLLMFSLGVFLLIMDVDLLQLRATKELTARGVSTEQFTNKLKLDMRPGGKILAAVGMFLGGWIIWVSSLGMIAGLLGLRFLYMIFINVMVVSLLLWGGFIFAATYLSSEEKDLRSMTQFTFEYSLRFDYNGNPNKTTSFEKMVDGMQVELMCCGINSYTEFSRIALNWVANTNNELVVPPSCCQLDRKIFWKNGAYVLNDNNCTRYPTLENSHILRPCYELMETNVQPGLGQFHFLAIGVPIFMLTLIALSAYLMLCGEGILCV